jgi:hypothetical protein
MNGDRRLHNLWFLLLLTAGWVANCSGENTTRKNVGMGPLESVLIQGEEDGWSGTLEGGVYRLQNRREPGGIRYFYTSHSTDDKTDRTVSVRVHAEQTGDDIAHAGLLYGYRQSPLFYYLITISTDSNVEIYRRDDAGVNLTMATSIEKEDDFVLLEVVEDGQEVQVRADSRTVSTFQSQGTGSGALGIAAMGIGRFAFTDYVENAHGAGPTNAAPATKTTPYRDQPSQQRTSGDVLRLKRFEIVDRDGFGTPVVAVSFLAPSNWQLEGGVQWNPTSPCVFEMVSVRAQAEDPNGLRKFEIFPKYFSQWIADPQTNRAMRASLSCRQAQPLKAADFVAQVFIPGFRPGARILQTEARPEAAQAMHEKVVAYEGADLERYQVRFNVDAVETRLAYDSQAGNVEEWLLATSTVSSMPTAGVMGGTTQLLSTFVENVLGFSTPANELDANRRLFAVIIASFRVNPVWEKAVREVMTNVGQIRMAGQLAQIEEIRRRTSQLFSEWNASIDRRDAEWTQRMAAQDRLFQNFTEAIRGTQTFNDPYDSGKSWEMTNEYQYVWKTPLDEFILTNDINFNPNVALKSSDWEQMRVAR